MSDAVQITADNRGPLIKVASWIMVIIMILTVAAKLSSKVFMVRKLQVDDYFLGAAAFFALGQVIAVSYEVDGGLGHPISDVPDITQFEKSKYASEILYVITLCLARLAVLWFLFLLARNAFRRNAIRLVAAIGILWTIIAVVVIIFQCPLPQTWAVESAKCMDIVAFWDVFGTVDILLDLAACFLPVLLLHDLKLGMSKKISVVIAFFVRLLLIPIIITRLVFITSAASSPSPTSADFNSTIATETHLCGAIIAACIPFLKPVMDSLQTGLLSSEFRVLASRHHRSTHAKLSGSPSRHSRVQHPLASMAKSEKAARRGRASIQRGIHGTDGGDRLGVDNNYTVDIRSTERDGAVKGHDENGSMSSQGPMLSEIKKTTKVTIVVSDKDGKEGGSSSESGNGDANPKQSGIERDDGEEGRRGRGS